MLGPMGIAGRVASVMGLLGVVVAIASMLPCVAAASNSLAKVPTGIIRDGQCQCLDLEDQVIIFIVDSGEILARGFATGFGAKVIQQLWYNQGRENTSAYRKDVLIVGSLMGLASACAFYGLSILIPPPLRRMWMQ